MAGSLRPQTHPLAFTADHTRLGALSVLLWHLYKSPCHLLFFCILSVFISGNLLVSYVSPLQSPYCFWEEVFRRCGINNNVFLFCLLYHQPGLPSPLFISSLSDAFFFFFCLKHGLPMSSYMDLSVVHLMGLFSLVLCKHS